MKARLGWYQAGAVLWLALAGLAAVGCGSGGSADTTTTKSTTSVSASPSPSASASGSPVSSLVGRWETNRTCQGLLTALTRVKLKPLAPAVVGEYFPGVDPHRLAKKPDLCEGASPQLHSHFFTEDGRFGSLDQDLNQVDDGNYKLLDGERLRIGNPDTGGVFDYHVEGDRLRLTPVFTESMKQQALAHRFEFTQAGWEVAVAYVGAWHRVDCEGWC